MWTLLTYLTACKVNRRIRKYLAEKRDIRKETARAGGEDDEDRGTMDPTAPGGTPEEAAMLVETVEWLMSQIEDPTKQQILSMRLEGYTADEIAATARVSPETVFRTLRKVRIILEKKLDRDREPAPTAG